MRAPSPAPTAQQIDAAVTLLRDMVMARSWTSLSVEVRVDGRVDVRIDGRRADADLIPGGPYPSPGVAIVECPGAEQGDFLALRVRLP